jgi:hypothetical protein
MRLASGDRDVDYNARMVLVAWCLELQVRTAYEI